MPGAASGNCIQARGTHQHMKVEVLFYADARADAMWLTECMGHRGLLSCPVRLAVTAHRSAGHGAPKQPAH